MTTPDPDEVCAHCGGDIPASDVVWLDAEDKVVIDGSPADPYHEECT